MADISCRILDYCLTVEGAKQVEKHRQFFTQVLDYVYHRNATGNKRPSLPQLFNIMKLITKQTEVNGIPFYIFQDVYGTFYCPVHNNG